MTNSAMDKLSQMNNITQPLILALIVLLTSCDSGGGGASINIEETLITVTADPLNTTKAQLKFEVSRVPDRGLYAGIGFETENESIISTDFFQTSASEGNIEIVFEPAISLVSGSYDNRVRMSVCSDSQCNEHIEGSPITIETTLMVSSDAHSVLIPEGETEVAPLSRTVLDHNIVDAEFSKALNSIVVVSSIPRNVAYIYSLDNIDTVDEIPLALEPTSVSIVNAGNSNKFVIGHDSQVSFVEFDPVNVDSSIVKNYVMPFNVFDLTATDSFIFAILDSPYNTTALYEIELSKGSVSESSADLSQQRRSKLTPDQSSLYFVSDQDEVEKLDIQARTLPYVDWTRFGGDYDLCSNLWISDEGSRVYTACGHTFRTSRSRFKDTDYFGRIPLRIKGQYQGYFIESISDSSLKNEISIVENDYGYIGLCEPTGHEACNSYLSFFTKDNLEKMQSSIFNLMSFGQRMYREKPLFVFYNNEGNRVYVISRPLAGPESKAQLLEFHRE